MVWGTRPGGPLAGSVMSTHGCKYSASVILPEGTGEPL